MKTMDLAEDNAVLDIVSAGVFCGEDAISKGSFHGSDQVSAGSFHC